MNVFEHAPADVVAERHARVGVGELEAVGVVEHFHAPHALGQRGGGSSELKGQQNGGKAGGTHGGL